MAKKKQNGNAGEGQKKERGTPIEVTCRLWEDGSFQVQGPLSNEVLVLGILQRGIVEMGTQTTMRKMRQMAMQKGPGIFGPDGIRIPPS